MNRRLICGAVGWYFGARSGLPTGPDLKDWHLDSLEQVPDSAMIVGTIDVEWFFDELIDENLRLLPTKADPDDVREAISDASKTHLGIDVLEAEEAVIWAAPERMAVAALIKGDFDGPLKGVAESGNRGVIMVRLASGVWTALVDEGLLVGTREGVVLGFDVATGEQKRLADCDDGALHRQALEAIEDGSVVVSAHTAGMAAMAGKRFAGLKAGAVALEAGGSLSASVVGEPSSLKAVVQLYEQSQQQLTSAVDQALASAEEEGQGELVMALTLAKHKLPDLYAAWTYEQDDDVLKISAPGQGGVIALYGAIAATLFYNDSSWE